MKKTLTTILLSLWLFAVMPAFAEDEPGVDGKSHKGPLTKITFIHYKKNSARAAGNGKNKFSSCYSFLASGAKWKTAENYYINPVNSGVNEGLVFNAITSSTAEWEKYGGDIFGGGAIDYNLNDNGGNLDNKNVAFFDSYNDPDVIAVTTVWGYFYGAPKSREIVEWDMQFNTGFAWGDAAVNPVLMDIQNIATHELGHSAGLGDLYTTACSAETMYGYASEGEISKRDLNQGDILGLQALY